MLRRIPHGFSLVELLITVAIIAIAMAFALPSFREMLTGGSTLTASNDLVASLAQARAEALKRGVFVAVIARSGSQDWSTGWEVRADSARDSGFATMVQSHEALEPGYRITAAATDGRPARVVFTPRGDLASAVAYAVNRVDLNICRPDKDVAKSRLVRIQASGEVTSRRDIRNSAAPSC